MPGQGSNDFYSIRPDRKMTGFIFKWFLYIIGIVIVLAIIGGIVGRTCDWFNAGADIVSPTNVKEQFRLGYDSMAALEAEARQVCNLQNAYDQGKKDGASQSTLDQRQSQLLAVKNNYESLRGQYNARMQDFFRAKLVAPPDLPDTAPTLQQTQQRLGICVSP